MPGVEAGLAERASAMFGGSEVCRGRGGIDSRLGGEGGGRWIEFMLETPLLESEEGLQLDKLVSDEFWKGREGKGGASTHAFLERREATLFVSTLSSAQAMTRAAAAGGGGLRVISAGTAAERGTVNANGFGERDKGGGRRRPSADLQVGRQARGAQKVAREGRDGCHIDACGADPVAVGVGVGDGVQKSADHLGEAPAVRVYFRKLDLIANELEQIRSDITYLGA
ncbi:hypothetical protein DFH11DRAFT_1834446 [Phellopilus nigrolimitatus]|nr:hypothetical protein DFH11DRAFT_1834446 [Phellopilus nigrolimitatus]